MIRPSVRALGPALALVLAAPVPAGGPGRAFADDGAEEDGAAVSASGALGVGAFGARPASTIDVGLDVARGELAFGLGGRLRLVAGAGARGEDWDEPSEGARILRYLTWTHRPAAPGGTAWSAAAGPLAGVRLGRGAVVAGFTTGLDVDHGRSGVHARLASGRLLAEAFVDDLAGPRAVAARAAWRAGAGFELGGTAALDVRAPDGAGGADVVGVVAAEAEWSPRRPVDGWTGALSLDLVGIPRAGAGAHPGAWVRRVRGGVTRLEAGLELRAGTDGYLPGWFSPLYELERERFGLERGRAGEGQWSVARARALEGLGGRAVARAVVPALGELLASYETRAGTRDLAVARVAVPALRRLQLGAWLAAERAAEGEPGARWAGVLAAEARVRLPARLFVVAELARLYRHDAAGAPGDAVAFDLEPLWTANLAVGAIIGRE